MADQEWTSASENGWNYPLARGEIVEVIEDNGMSTLAEQPAIPLDPHVHSRTGLKGSLTEVSSWLSEHRTVGCLESHHPSLAEWCPDCSGTRRQEQQPSTEDDRLLW